MPQNNPFDSKRGEALKIESGADLIAVFIATGFGAGFIPFGPGTWGSIVGLLIAYGLIAAKRFSTARTRARSWLTRSSVRSFHSFSSLRICRGWARTGAGG